MSISTVLEQKLKINFSDFKTILFAALIMRLLAAIFSQGYGMHDDHFLIIEASSSWVDGYDYNGWLPWSEGNRGRPEGHSFSYVGINYFFFYICKFFGLSDPKTLMLFNRILHALLSMLVVYFGIKITEKISNRKNAVTVGWLLALLSIMPFLSVRNLVELSSIPFLMWGVWLMIKNDRKVNIFYAGLLIGLAVSFRYQIAVFAIGIMMYYFFNWKFKAFFLFSLGTFVTFVLTQGLVDYLIWGYPFAEFIAYSTYNMEQGVQYLPNSNYFMYLWVLMGVLLFPFGLLMGIGFFKSAKENLLLFLPTVIFLLFHTFYPNRQERFILSVLPFFIILGVIGFQSFRKNPTWDKLWNFSYSFFWILNIPIMLFLSFTYTKMSRVEAMYVLYGDNLKDERILLEGSAETKTSMLPKFYSGSWYCLLAERNDTITPLTVFEGQKYDYIFFFGEDKLQERVKEYKVLYPKLKLIKKCEPSLIDKLVRKLNPRNSNQYIEVWRTYEPVQKK
jgi:hypothetical protein